jgi:hypothetical protein
MVAFLGDHPAYPFPSPALFRKLGERFRTAVASFAARTGRSGVAGIGDSPRRPTLNRDTVVVVHQASDGRRRSGPTRLFAAGSSFDRAAQRFSMHFGAPRLGWFAFSRYH